MNNELFEQSIEYGKAGKINEWVHRFLLSSGNNAPLSDGLNKAKRHWIGPIEYDLSKLIRVGGPEEGMEYPETQESWDVRVNKMCIDLAEGWQPAPLIAEYNNGVLKIRDGGHRFGALQKSGYKKYWTIIWCNNEEDYLSIKDKLS